MKLTQLHLGLFRSGVNLTLNLDGPRILIAGVNGAGKSTIREAIRWILTGHCAVTDARGVGYERLVPHGMSSVSASLTVKDLGSIDRSRKNGIGVLQVEGFNGDGTSQQDALYQKLNVSPAWLDAALETEYFLRLHHADGKALILGLLDVKVPIGGELLTLDQVDSRYKTAFEERKVAKNRLRAYVVPEKPTEQMPAIETIEGQLGKLRVELQTVLESVASVAGQRTALTRLLQQTQQTPTVPDVPADLEAQIEALSAEVSALEVESTVAQMAPPTRQAPPENDVERVAFLRDRIEALTAHKPKEGCVLDAGVECKSAKILFTNRVKELKAELAGLDTDLPEEGTVPAPSPLPELRKRLRELVDLRSRHAAAIQFAEDRETSLEQIQADLAALPDTAEQDAAAETLRTRIGKGELLLQRARVYWEAAERYTKAVQHQKQLQTEVDDLEERCDLLGPKGARVQALAEAIGPFEAKINSFVARFGWTVAFSVDPWEVLVNHRAVETYSESEQFRIGIGIQLAIAELSGLSFAVIDRLDLLDVRNRALATEMILQAPLEQILVLSTREPEQKLPTSILAYRLALDEQGRTTVVERTQ